MAQFELANQTDHTINWDWETQHVNQAYSETLTGQEKEVSVYDIVESGTVLICAGPASLTSLNVINTGTRLVPIGLVETATIAMSKPLSRIFEIGSKLSYIIPGRTVGEIALARVLFDGPSLLKVLYQGEVIEDSQTSTGKKYAKFSNGKILNEASAIGSGSIAMNLASTFFDQPVGLGFFFKDRQSDVVSQMYFEGCSVSTWNIGIAANMNVLTESIRMEFVQCVPIITQAAHYTTVPGANNQIFDTPIVGSAQ